ncbi:uncharacterized protein LOC122577453, partial [Bombus pyrosoma]|uniref:uncharacterized protein LOC122577453 n=1 Tax=Bombus pyrosoma TaxID=396416 RepID=UPI001CB94EAE
FKTLLSRSTLLFAGIISAQINITPLEGNSVFVENIRKGYLYSDTANIIVGLDTSDIHEQINTIELHKSTINSRAISKEYAEELDGLQIRINNLKQLAKHLKTLIHTRSKRGLLNIIGSVSKSLFGTLDEDDLTLINENIDKLFDDNNKIKTVIANQTALIRKIVNSENLNHLEKSYNDVLKQQQQANIDRFMLKMIIKLDTEIQTLHFQLDEILNVIILGKQGIISPQILDPDEFIENYAKAIGSQAYNTAISAKTEHFQFILDISDLKIFTIGNKIFFKIIVPLVSNTEWNILQVYPILSKRNGIFLAPVVEHQIYLTSGLSFINTDIEYLDKLCKERAGTTICKQTIPIHDRNSRTDCHSEIINFKPYIEHCQITVFKIEDISFIPLRTSNSYIAIPANPIEIDTICQTKHTLQKLDKPSVIRANTSCDILYK